MCLVGMTMFLRRIGDIMSLVKCEPHFRPGFNGLKDLYDDQWKLLTRNGFGDSGQLRMAVGIPRVGEFSIYGAEHHEPARRTDLNMDRATHLFLNGGQAEFANNPIEDGGQQCTALSRGGLCIWLDCLSALRADAESMSSYQYRRWPDHSQRERTTRSGTPRIKLGKDLARPWNGLPKAECVGLKAKGARSAIICRAVLPNSSVSFKSGM